MPGPESNRSVRTLCEIYGMGPAERAHLLKALRLDDSRYPQAERLRQFLAPGAKRVVDRFYAYLGRFAETRKFLPLEIIPSLKLTQAEYLRTLGERFCEESYFEGRIRIGSAHARVEMPLQIYNYAYRELQRLILLELPEDLPRKERAELEEFLLDIIALDMTLAIETYHSDEVNYLERALASLEDKQKVLRRALRTDELTGLPNRTAVLSLLGQALCDETSLPLCVMMVDIDHFKLINDTRGHPAGDQVLQAVGGRMRSTLRSDTDLVARYGGDEFLVLLRRTAAERAQMVADRMRERVGGSPIGYDDKRIPVTVSIGMVFCDTINASAEELIAQADTALYESKAAGRNATTGRWKREDHSADGGA